MPSKIALSFTVLAAAMPMASAAPHHGVDFTSYNAGHNVASTNENKLVDLSKLFLGLDILKRDVTSVNGGHNVESTNENKLIDLSKLTALISILKREEAKSYAPLVQARDSAEDVFRRTNDDEDCTCVKKPKKPVVHTPKPEECAPSKTNTWTPPKETHHHGHHTKTTKPWSPPKETHHSHSKTKTWTWTKTRTHVQTPEPTPSKKPEPKPTAPSCGSNEVYVNKGHNVVSTNENKLLDLSDITINLSILDLGKKEQKTVKGDATCQSEYGCCVPSSKYYYDGGHNVKSTNENKLLDLSGLNLGLDLL